MSDPLATLLHRIWREDRGPFGDPPSLETIAARLRAAGVRGPEDGLRETAQAVVDAFSALNSAWLVPKVNREEQLGKPMASLTAHVAVLRAALRSTPAALKEDDRG